LVEVAEPAKYSSGTGLLWIFRPEISIRNLPEKLQKTRTRRKIAGILRHFYPKVAQIERQIPLEWAVLFFFSTIFQVSGAIFRPPLPPGFHIRAQFAYAFPNTCFASATHSQKSIWIQSLSQ
jgi:hypothetical protein